MNNLKRVLSLALASVMVLGMMVVGASATEFDDDKDIVNQTAVETMNALGIVTGRGDGNFDPKGFVKRSEMATMIAKALNGGELPNLGLAGKGTFSDVPETHWAAEYIYYCESLGIIAGRGNGKFDPDTNVTGQEAAKMMLVALGYDPDIFGFASGAKWATVVDGYASVLPLTSELDGEDMVAATTISLYDDVAGARALPLTREDAAQLIYNGLQACTVTSKITGIQAGAPAYKFNLFDKSLLEKTFKATVATGTLTASNYSAKDGVYTYTITADGEDENIGTVVSATDVSASFLQKVRVIYTGSGENMEVLAVSPASAVSAANYIGKAAFKTAKDKEGNFVTTLDGKPVADTVDVITFNGGEIENAYVAAVTGDDAVTTEAKFDTSKVGKWVNYSLIMASGEVAHVVVYPTDVAKVADVKDGVVTDEDGIKYTIENTDPSKVNATTKDTLAAGDYVLVSAAANLPTKLEKLTVLADQTATAVDTVTMVYTIGGKEYTLAGDATINPTTGLGKAYGLVIVNGYVLAADNGEGTTSNEINLGDILYVTEVGAVVASGTNDLGVGTGKVQKVRVVFTDGTSDVINVSKLGGSAITDTQDSEVMLEDGDEGLYAFVPKSGKYELTKLVSTPSVGEGDDATDPVNMLGFTGLKDDVTSITAGGKSGTIRFATDAVLFVEHLNAKGEAVVEIMKGADINGWKNTATVVSTLYTKYNATSGLETVGFGVISVKDAEGQVDYLPGEEPTDPNNYGYLVSNPINVYNPDAKATQKQVKVWNGTETVTYFVNLAEGEFTNAAGDIIKFSTQGNVIVAVDGDVATAKCITAFDGTIFYFTEDDSHSLNDAKAVIYIDDAKKTGAANGTIRRNADGKNNVYYVATDDGKFVLFVDVNNVVTDQGEDGDDPVGTTCTHENVSKVDGNETSCEYWQCQNSECSKKFSDEAHTQELTGNRAHTPGSWAANEDTPTTHEKKCTVCETVLDSHENATYASDSPYECEVDGCDVVDPSQS